MHACRSTLEDPTVDDGLLRRDGPLTATESAHVRQHAALGAGLAARVLDAEKASWIRHHHERCDGAGYPEGRGQVAIPDGAQVLAPADAWDAMTEARPYGAPLTVDAARAEIARHAGGQFHPDAAALLDVALTSWAPL